MQLWECYYEKKPTSSKVVMCLYVFVCMYTYALINLFWSNVCRFGRLTLIFIFIVFNSSTLFELFNWSYIYFTYFRLYARCFKIYMQFHIQIVLLYKIKITFSCSQYSLLIWRNIICLSFNHFNVLWNVISLRLFTDHWTDIILSISFAHFNSDRK